LRHFKWAKPEKDRIVVIRFIVWKLTNQHQHVLLAMTWQMTD
jgi:hypothetical protein